MPIIWATPGTTPILDASPELIYVRPTDSAMCALGDPPFVRIPQHVLAFIAAMVVSGQVNEFAAVNDLVVDVRYGSFIFQIPNGQIVRKITGQIQYFERFVSIIEQAFNPNATILNTVT